MNSQTIDSITVDLNRVTRRDFRAYVETLTKATAEERDAATAELVGRVVTAWPFGDVTPAAYLDLGLLDAARVDTALNEAMELIGKKKSASSLTPPGDSTAA